MKTGFNRVGKLRKMVAAALVLSMVFATEVSAAELTDSNAELGEVLDLEERAILSEGLETVNDEIDALKDDYSEEDQNVTKEDLDAISEELDSINDEAVADDSDSDAKDTGRNNVVARDPFIDELSAIIANHYTAMIGLINGYQADIIKGLNNTVYANDKISENASFPDIISKINNIPTPKIDGTINDKGEVTLGIGETITIPAGYYPDGITVTNNVVNRGKLNWAPTGKTTYSVPSGYYEGGTLDSSKVYDAAYNAGYNAGRTAGINSAKAEARRKVSKPQTVVLEGNYSYEGYITFNELSRIDGIIGVDGIKTNDSISAALHLEIVNGNQIYYRVENRYGGAKRLSITAVQYSAFN